MFRGTSFHNIDPKGRLIVPARFRKDIKDGGDDGVMVSKMDGGLVAYTAEEWGRIESRVLALSEKSDYMRRFRRVFLGGAFECPCDKQSRILIPPVLRQYAALTKEVVLVGVLDHFEIWSRAKWDTENDAMEDDMQKEEVRNAIAKLGL